MVAHSLGLAAAFGLAANAFLLPPAVSTHDIEAADSSSWIWMHIDPTNQPLIVPCDGCEIDESGPKSLLLDMTTGSQPGTLELNGKPFYPPPPGSPRPDSSELTALAVPPGVSLVDAQSQPEKYTSVYVSGWTVHSDNFMTEQGEEILEVTFHVTEIERRRVATQSVRLTVMKDSKVDSLTILSTGLSKEHEAVAAWEAAAAAAAHDVVKADEPACEGALCQWRQFIEDKIHGISAAAHSKFGHGRPCPGKMMGMMKDGMMKDGMPHGHRPSTNMHHGPDSHHNRPIGETGRPHHHHGHPKLPNGHHHTHHTVHQFMHRVGRFIMAIAIPILIGIAAGILTYAVGMVLGCAIALIWIKVFRGGKRGYASVAQAEHEAAAKDLETEADPRASYESAPPVYEDTPAYEEKQVV